MGWLLCFRCIAVSSISVLQRAPSEICAHVFESPHLPNTADPDHPKLAKTRSQADGSSLRGSTVLTLIMTISHAIIHDTRTAR